MTDCFFIHANANIGRGLSLKIPTSAKDKAIKALVNFFNTKGEVHYLYNHDFNPFFIPLFDGSFHNTLFQVGIENVRDKRYSVYYYTLFFNENEDNLEEKIYIALNEIFYDWTVKNNIDKIIN